MYCSIYLLGALTLEQRQVGSQVVGLILELARASSSSQTQDESDSRAFFFCILSVERCQPSKKKKRLAQSEGRAQGAKILKKSMTKR